MLDLTAPGATHTATSSLNVGTAITAISPSTSATDIADYAATGLPPGLQIDTGTGGISGMPTANSSTQDTAVTVTDDAGNSTEVTITFPRWPTATRRRAGSSTAPPR